MRTQNAAELRHLAQRVAEIRKKRLLRRKKENTVARHFGGGEPSAARTRFPQSPQVFNNFGVTTLVIMLSVIMYEAARQFDLQVSEGAEAFFCVLSNFVHSKDCQSPTPACEQHQLHHVQLPPPVEVMQQAIVA